MKLTGNWTMAMFSGYNTVNSEDARLTKERVCRFLEGSAPFLLPGELTDRK
jgi:hypothetical protein